MKDAKGERGDLGYPRIILFLGLGSPWDNMAHLGQLAFYFPGTLGCTVGYPTRFYFIFILQILQNNFQSGWRNSCINMLFFPVFPTWLGTYNFILKIILVQGPQPHLGTLQGDDLNSACRQKEEHMLGRACCTNQQDTFIQTNMGCDCKVGSSNHSCQRSACFEPTGIAQIQSLINWHQESGQGYHANDPSVAFSHSFTSSSASHVVAYEIRQVGYPLSASLSATISL